MKKNILHKVKNYIKKNCCYSSMDEMMDKELKGHPKRTHYMNIWNNQRVQIEKEKYEFTLLAKPMEKFIAGNPRPRLS